MSPRAAARLVTLGFTDVFEYGPGKQDWSAAGLPLEGLVEEVPKPAALARQDVPTCTLDETIAAVRPRLEASGLRTCFVVHANRVVLGRLFEKDLVGEPDTPVEQVMREGPVTFRPDMPAGDLLQFMLQNDLSTAPITTSKGELVGLLLRSDLEEAARRWHAAHHHHHAHGAQEHAMGPWPEDQEHEAASRGGKGRRAHAPRHPTARRDW